MVLVTTLEISNTRCNLQPLVAISNNSSHLANYNEWFRVLLVAGFLKVDLCIDVVTL